MSQSKPEDILAAAEAGSDQHELDEFFEPSRLYDDADESEQEPVSAANGECSLRPPTANELMTAALTEAGQKVTGDRQRDYGSPASNHKRTAAMWELYVAARYQSEGDDYEQDGFDVCMENILQKISRLAHHRTHDSVVDIIGYGANAASILGDKPE